MAPRLMAGQPGLARCFGLVRAAALRISTRSAGAMGTDQIPFWYRAVTVISTARPWVVGRTPASAASCFGLVPAVASRLFTRSAAAMGLVQMGWFRAATAVSRSEEHT